MNKRLNQLVEMVKCPTESNLSMGDPCNPRFVKWPEVLWFGIDGPATDWSTAWMVDQLGGETNESHSTSEPSSWLGSRCDFYGRVHQHLIGSLEDTDYIQITTKKHDGKNSAPWKKRITSCISAITPVSTFHQFHQRFLLSTNFINDSCMEELRDPLLEAFKFKPWTLVGVSITHHCW